MFTSVGYGEQGRTGEFSIQGVIQLEADFGIFVIESYEEGSHMVIVVFQAQKSSGTARANRVVEAERMDTERPIGRCSGNPALW